MGIGVTGKRGFRRDWSGCFSSGKLCQERGGQTQWLGWIFSCSNLGKRFSFSCGYAMRSEKWS